MAATLARLESLEPILTRKIKIIGEAIDSADNDKRSDRVDVSIIKTDIDNIIKDIDLLAETLQHLQREIVSRDISSDKDEISVGEIDGYISTLANARVKIVNLSSSFILS